jgi:alpha-D-ribose 1-methylphosphonate 5-triphosphate synthase subunit PhnG
MNRRERTELLVEFGREESVQMAHSISQTYEVEEISAPKEVLVMVKVREGAQNSLFYLGEVLATETKVRINGEVGLGLVKGSEKELSEALAIIDAAYQSRLDETKSWNNVLQELLKRKQDKEEKQRKLLSATKVSFDTMKP